jgi:lipoprotein-anchoring transpeptidase ErfK/SrfK
MKNILIAVALALSACSTAPVGPVQSPSEVSVPPVVISAVDAFSKAVDGYAAAARAAQIAVTADVLSDDQLRMVRTLNNKALELIEGGNTGLTIAQRAASLELISKQLNSILGN